MGTSFTAWDKTPQAMHSRTMLSCRGNLMLIPTKQRGRETKGGLRTMAEKVGQATIVYKYSSA